MTATFILSKTLTTAAGRKLNAILLPTSGLVEKMMGEQRKVRDVLTLFRKEDMLNRGWATRQRQGTRFA